MFRPRLLLLSKLIAEGVRNNPHAELFLMEKTRPGYLGQTSEASYHKTISIINAAEDLYRKYARRKRFFGA